MIIQLKNNIDKKTIDGIYHDLGTLDIPVYPVRTGNGHYLVCTPKQEFDIRKIGQLKGVADVHRVSGPHKLVNAQWKVGSTKIDFGNGLAIGGKDLAVMAGPCSIEGEEQVKSTVEQLVKNGVKFMRGGVYKPRTSPYSFRGLGMDGLKMLHRHCAANGIKIVTEVMEKEQIEPMLPYVDIFQVGARNAQNFNLLEALGKIDKPVLIKRGISGTIDELLHSAEYIFKNGNEQLLLCERGIRTFEKAYRNTLDLNAVPILKEKSHLPVIVDPSHGIGIREHVITMALAGIAAGADGILMEIHECPDQAATDAKQTIDYASFHTFMEKANALHALIRN